MKFKFILFVIIFYLFNSCVGKDYEGLPYSIKEAKTKNVLFDVYASDKKTVEVNNNTYLIKEAFTSTKWNSKKDKTINKNVFNFIFKLQNIENGKDFEFDFNEDIYEYINFHSEKGGIHSSNLSISYKDTTARNELDTIRVGFLNNKRKENIVTFVKQKK